MTVLAAELLSGRAVALVGGADAVRTALAGLGARVEGAAPEGPLDAIVYDAASAFGGGGQAGLRAASAQAWSAIREVVTTALIPQQRGKAVIIGPRPDAGPFAQAARAALENLARTLSVEWARYRVTVTMISPGASTTDEQLAELVCFLVSPAGDYFSGCQFSLGGCEPAA